MDINSLLSPQETPQGTPISSSKAPARKPRKPRASKLSQPSPLAKTTLPPHTLPHTAVVQAQNASSSPSLPSPASGARVSATNTPPNDTSRATRQPSTPGMDALADLASMQHHQQITRVNAGGLRTAEIYDNPTSSASILPNLLAMSREQATTQLREPAQLRGGSLEIAMAEGLTVTPPRKYSTSALSEEDLQQVAQLASYLSSNPFAYESHIQLINLLRRGFLNHVQLQSSSSSRGDPHTYDLLQDLENARGTMRSRFALGEDVWAEWLEDQILLASSLEQRISIMELCQQAVEEEPQSTRLWLVYGDFMLSLYMNANPHDARVAGLANPSAGPAWSRDDRIVAREVFTWPQMVGVWKRGTQETTLRIDDSSRLWDTYTDLLLQELASSTTQEAISGMQYHFVNRLQVPHKSWDATFQAYSNFISRYENASYEVTMVAAARLGAEAKDRYGVREEMETRLLQASRKSREAELQAFNEYLEWELGHSRRKKIFDFDLTITLYQRATLRFPASTDLWEAYTIFLNEELSHIPRSGVSVISALEKAVKHCPWSGNLWSHYLVAAENNRLPFTDIGDIKHKATSTGLLDAGGMEEVLKVHTAWCGFLRRRAFQQDATDEEIDVAEVGIRSAIEDMETLGRTKFGADYQGDPEGRLEWIYIKYLTQCHNWDGARESFKKLIPSMGNSWTFWVRYWGWEMTTWCKLTYSENDSNGRKVVKPTEATKVLEQAIKRPKLDWPEKMIETYQYHCEDHEDADELQLSLIKVWKAKKAVRKRREKEALDAYEVAQVEAVRQQQEAQQDNSDYYIDHDTIGKRKREDNVDEGINKKIRHDVSTETNPGAEEPQSPNHSLFKRDRENATIVVKNLPITASETRIRQYFRDCGTINSLKVFSDTSGDSLTASIEFDSKEDVLTAQTKDMKTFDDKAIEVQVGSGSTLYVCNFPPTADEAWIRKTFGKYGEIVDIRFPSLKYNHHRRFCYVQFRSSEEAHAATKIDGDAVGDDLRILAKISDPGHKKPREGALYEGRELFLGNLDWHASEKDIRRLFSKYGDVEKVRIPKKVDGTSKGIGFVVFSNEDEATAALELNLTKFKSRILNVHISTNDVAKRQATQIIISSSQRSTASPTPGLSYDAPDGKPYSAASPKPSTVTESIIAEIQSRTLALMGVPDTINNARIRELAEPYGELIQVKLRPSNQGAVLEYKDVASVGNAQLALEGHEITPGRKLHTGTVGEMKQQKPEIKTDRISTGPTKVNTTLQPSATIRRPTQTGTRRGGKGGLGLKRSGAGLNGPRADEDGKGKVVETNGDAADPTGQAKVKSNADFRAMFVKEGKS